MRTSFFALCSLTILLIASVLDATGFQITFSWIPLVTLIALTVLLIADREARQPLFPVLWPVAIWLVLLGMYVVNPTHAWEDGVGLLPRQSIPFLPGSVHSPSSFRAWMVVATAAGLYVLALCLRRDEMRWFRWLVLAGSAVVAFSALNDRLVHRAFPVFERTGPFAYENHYAAFANLLLPVVWATGLRFRYTAISKGHLSSPAGLTVIVACMLATSILVSGSRAGVALMGMTGVVGLWWTSSLERKYRNRLPLHSISARLKQIGAAAAMVVVTAMAVQRYGASVSGLGSEINFRFTLLSDAWRVWLDSFWWGTGPGTYRLVIPYYQSESLGSVQVAHAHCDPLQWLAELGLWGMTGSLVLIGLIVKRTWRSGSSQSNERPTFGELERPAFGLGLLTVSLHSLIDFPWRMPAIVWVAAVWCASMTSTFCEGSPGRERKSGPENSSRWMSLKRLRRLSGHSMNG